MLASRGEPSTGVLSRGSVCSRSARVAVGAQADVAAPGNGVNGKRSALTRSDYIAWIDLGATAPAHDWGALRTVVHAADRLVTD